MDVAGERLKFVSACNEPVGCSGICICCVRAHTAPTGTHGRPADSNIVGLLEKSEKNGKNRLDRRKWL